MDAPRGGPRNPIAVLATVYLLLGVVIALLGRGARWLLAKQTADGGLSHDWAPLAAGANAYFAARGHVLAYWPGYALAVVIIPAVLLLGLRRLAASLGRWREELAGTQFRGATYDLPRVPFSLRDLILANPAPQSQVVLGVDATGAPMYLTDRTRSMHVHCLGQTGSGKTKSVIEPLLFQDLLRGRGVLVVDGKGAQESEEQLAALAAAAGRLGELRVFTLSPFRPSHTYNPLHLVADADPRAVAERVFSSFAEDMDNPYYRDQSRMFFSTLVCAFAGTGQRFSLRDVHAALASRPILDHALDRSSDAAARRAIHAQLDGLGHKAGETFTGLLAAVQRYDHPAVNAYAPDIVLEDAIDQGQVTAFYLPANYYKHLARYLGLAVFQHVQQLGALRQLDRGRPQRPVYVFADEFYSFAYEGFTDAVNKLRDAQVAILLAHQTFSDLEKVSPEYAQGIWDNTRTKVILYQNDFEICERIAKALGTEKQVSLTVRRSTDAFLNSMSTLEASSREVDAYRLHPNRIKHLACGQAYVAEEARFAGVNLRPLPTFPPAVAPVPRAPSGEGLRLWEQFVAEGGDVQQAGEA